MRGVPFVALVAVLGASKVSAQYAFTVLPHLGAQGPDLGQFLSGDGIAVYGTSAGLRTIWRDGVPSEFPLNLPEMSVQGIAGGGNLVGGSYRPEPFLPRRVFRWTPLNTATMNSSSSMYGISADGVIVGSTLPPNSEYIFGFAWGGSLSFPGNGTYSVVRYSRAALRGSTISGYLSGPPTAFIYRGQLPWWTYIRPPAEPTAISPDGFVFVVNGSRWLANELSYSPTGFVPQDLATGGWRISGTAAGAPAVWDPVRGVRLVADVLTEGGIGTDGVALTSVFGMSASGGVLAGNGLQAGNSVVWVATIPQFCYGNCDGSTADPVLNILDFTCYLDRFSGALAGDPVAAVYANCDNSTIAPAINVLDFNCFLNSFVTGCQ